MKILTIFGTRPEIIRLSLIIKKLDQLCNHKILHTGQNYTHNLSNKFFEEMQIRKPDVILNNYYSTQSAQIGSILEGTEKLLNEFEPDKVLILGDTNSGLASIICKRKGIPVYHMEAGNRCYDERVPEENNRKIIDAISTINMPYTELSRQNLLREGLPNNKIITTGNPIKEVISYYQKQINQSPIINKLKLTSGNYVIATAHRAENVDTKNSLENIIQALKEISREQEVVFSCHPRTKEKLKEFNIDCSNIKVIEPIGFFDFVHLEQHCYMAVSDSGTVQEELCLFGKPTITIRETTERPETVMCGSNLVSGLNKNNIVDCYNVAKTISKWKIPVEYNCDNVSDIVIGILNGNNRF